jgi:hypothetical protein
VEGKDTTPIVADDEEAIEHTKRDRWNGEEIHRRNTFPMIAEEGEPLLREFRPLGALRIQWEMVISETSDPCIRRSLGCETIPRSDSRQPSGRSDLECLLKFAFCRPAKGISK